METTCISHHDFFPYADNTVFPKLKTVLVTVHQTEWDNTRLGPPPGSPVPKWSVRVLDVYSPSLAEQVDVEFGHVKDPPDWKLLREGGRSATILKEIQVLVKKGLSVWESEEPQDFVPGVMERLPNQDELSKVGATNMWLQATRYLRTKYRILEDGDREYMDYRSCFWQKQSKEESYKELEWRRNYGKLPVFCPVIMVHKAPLV